jgi:hypothetical protein
VYHTFSVRPNVPLEETVVAKKREPAGDLSDRIENAVRDAISKVPGVNDVSELDYCKAVNEALEVIAVGVSTRAQELADE